MSKDDLAAAAAKTAPPAAVVGWSWVTHITLNDLVATATLIYVLLQVVVLLRKEFGRRRETDS